MDITQLPSVKFSTEFTSEVDKYIERCKQQNEKPTVRGFAKSIGTDQQAVWAWALKPKKDEKGNVTKELARPHFHAAISKLNQLEKEVEKDKLTPQQELFCKLYASDREFFGNGVQAYIEAYDIDLHKPGAYNSARSSAYDNLTKPYLLKRINELLEMGNLNDSFVDKQLEFVITQNADFGSKVAAIREYNKLKQRITEKFDHTTKGQKIIPILGGVSNAVPANDSNS